jgi:hypothetical protein
MTLMVDVQCYKYWLVLLDIAYSYQVSFGLARLARDLKKIVSLSNSLASCEIAYLVI